MISRDFLNSWAASIGILCLIILATCMVGCGPTLESEARTESSPTEFASATPTPTATLPVPPQKTAEATAVGCPTESVIFELFADHAFWTDTGMGKWNWEANGAVPVVLEASGVVAGSSKGTILGRQYGVFSDGQNSCQFEAPAEITLSARGVCQEGVLVLEITENWVMGSYDWVCDEDSFRFELPPIGTAVHPDIRFPLDQSQPTVEFPFMGGGGAKYWTLSPSVEPVP